MFGKKRRASGYAILVVFLGLFIFALLYAAEIFVSNQTSGMIATQGANWTNSYDPGSNTAMNEILFPGLGIMIGLGAIIEIINRAQERKNGGEEYL